jgi:hypothetical protein
MNTKFNKILSFLNCVVVSVLTDNRKQHPTYDLKSTTSNAIIRLLLTILLLLSVSLLTTLIIPLQAQEFSYRALDKVHGMPTNTVYDLHQDKKGFLWFGTDRGLFRYDGNEYKLYYNSKQDGKSISNLMEDAQGRIWCQNFSGQYFYTQSDSLVFCKELKPIGVYTPAQLIQLRYLVNNSSNKIRIFDINTFKTKELPNLVNASPFSSNDGVSYYLTNESELLKTDLKGRQETYKLPPNLNPFYIQAFKDKLYALKKVDVSEISVIQDGKIVDKIDLGRKNLVQNIKLIAGQNLALFTSSGFYLIDLLSNQKLYLPFLTDKNTTALVKDLEGNFWVSTVNSGVLFIPSFSVKIIEPQTAFTRLFVNNESILTFGTSKNQVFTVNLKNNSKELLNDGKTNDEVLALYYDSDSKMLLYCSNIYHVKQNKQTQNTVKIAIKDFEKIDRNRIAFAATGVMGYVDLNNKKGLVRLTDSGERHRAVVVDTIKKVIYSATSKGLLKIDLEGNRSEIKDNGESISILDLAIQYENKQAKIYAASTTKGIYFIENDQILKNITKNEGLEDNGVYKIKVYKNQLWWLTENAVQACDLKTKAIRTYTKADGLPETDLKDIEFVNDQVYVATLAGLVTFPTNQPSRNLLEPKILVNSVSVNKNRTELDKQLEFNHDQNNIDIHFSVLSFRSVGEMKISYQINNQGWNLLETNSRTLSLPSLSPDNYQIQLKAVDLDGLESKIMEFEFTIKKPFWTTYWFLGIIIGVIGLIAYWITNNNLKRVQREATLQSEKLMLEKELQRSLLMAIRSQMNPHFIFNALNSIQEQFLYGDKILASEQMGNFTYLTRQILDVSGKKNISINAEIEILTKYLELEKMRFTKDFEYKITVDESVDEDYHQIPPLLIQPFVENSIRHGLLHKYGNKKVEIHFKLDSSEENLICNVEDNGIGRERATEIKSRRVKKSDSFSTSATEERLKLLNNDFKIKDLVVYEDLKDESNNVLGTRVFIRIPLGT